MSLLMLQACGSGDAGTGSGSGSGNNQSSQPFAQIAQEAAIRFAGTEPFWGGRVADGVLVWSTPDNLDGEAIAVTRFAGLGGLSFSGTLAGQNLDLAITPGACSDGMSDRRYAYVATASIGGDIKEGCAWIEGEEPAGAS